ncbi:hypothetical protein H8S37_04330 [Mediterraneibacter sp. NSJ-55]|uniref:Uncharacterized protein n=1 Tax=Mediterraneibacter hominis TaxID=2763054 RepID=A0A923LH35_9FIRM|nr:hypothetical protein [Mediterraneibacter hominis]MBC5688160.1 hypothetical protein [Mediterraneibacter hominis]
MNEKFNWVCDNIGLLETWLKNARNNVFPDNDDFITHIRVGVLCLDLINKNIDDIEYLCADLYVGGIDTGYGYANLEGESYPYDYCDEIGHCWKVDDIKNEDSDSVLKIVAEEIENQIVKNEQKYPYCSLIGKAMES